MEQNISENELSKQLSNAAKLVIVGADYRHYKNKTYTVLCLAIQEYNNEVCVVYQAQYGKKLTFIRPVSNWVERVDHEGKILKRFLKI